MKARISSREGRKSLLSSPVVRPEIRFAKRSYSSSLDFFAGAFLAAGFLVVVVFLAAGAFLTAVAFLVAAFVVPDFPALAAISSRAFSTVTDAGSLPFGSVALTLPQFT